MVPSRADYTLYLLLIINNLQRYSIVKAVPEVVEAGFKIRILHGQILATYLFR